MTPDSWHREAARILRREQRQPEPTQPTDCGELCGYCDACNHWYETNKAWPRPEPAT